LTMKTRTGRKRRAARTSSPAGRLPVRRPPRTKGNSSRPDIFCFAPSGKRRVPNPVPFMATDEAGFRDGFPLSPFRARRGNGQGKLFPAGDREPVLLRNGRPAVASGKKLPGPCRQRSFLRSRPVKASGRNGVFEKANIPPKGRMNAGGRPPRNLFPVLRDSLLSVTGEYCHVFSPGGSPPCFSAYGGPG